MSQIIIETEAQILTCLLDPALKQRANETFPISTSKFGLGEEGGTFKTPRGKFEICAKFGEEVPVNGIFNAREWTGEILTPVLEAVNPEADFILTRILWLNGLERHNKNTRSRFIYIHGTPDSEPMGEPHSHGCIRMRNYDVIQLFDWASVGDEVLIR